MPGFDVLQHLDVWRDTLRLDRTSGRGEVAGGGQPERSIAGAERNDGLQPTLAERARAEPASAPAPPAVQASPTANEVAESLRAKPTPPAAAAAVNEQRPCAAAGYQRFR